MLERGRKGKGSRTKGGEREKTSRRKEGKVLKREESI
jgi:hypothetical protein